MLTTTIRDAGEFCHLLSIVRHFLEAALQYRECELHLVKTNLGNEIATQTDKNSGIVLRPSGSSGGSSKSLLGTSLEPMVLIKDRDRTTKMVCPPLAVIEEHSPVLYPLLKVGTVLPYLCLYWYLLYNSFDHYILYYILTANLYFSLLNNVLYIPVSIYIILTILYTMLYYTIGSDGPPDRHSLTEAAQQWWGRRGDGVHRNRAEAAGAAEEHGGGLLRHPAGLV